MSETPRSLLPSYFESESLQADFNVEVLLSDRLVAAARGGPGKGIVYVRGSGDEVAQSYAELLEQASRVAAALQEVGLEAGSHVLLQLEAGEDFIPGLWGCILAGAIPVPVAVAPTYVHPNSALQKLTNAWELLEQPPILAAGPALEGLRVNGTFGSGARAILDIEELSASKAEFVSVRREATDTAVLLLTSGSTGRPKGVPLSHRNLLAMAAGTKQANGFSADDVTLNWMALDHVGAVSFLGTMAMDLGCKQIHVPTSYILQNPLRWLDLISRHRATISWAPNFAFTLFLERAKEVEEGKWDLSSMRFLVNAGEPVVARTARGFIRLLQRHGLPTTALRPAFGMSETCSGITWSRGLTLENTTDETPFVDLGPSIPGSAMRVVDEEGNVLQEGEHGLLQFRGPSVFDGYFRNPEETAETFREGWFTTGDLACLRDGSLYITGRQKDVIIVNGSNFYCHELESVVETLPGLIKTFTAACAVREPGSETEQLALFFCPEKEDLESVASLAKKIRSILIQQGGIPPAFLVALQTGDVPKTEIGKIQRPQLKKAFEAGEFKEKVIRAGVRNGTRKAVRKIRSPRELAPAIAEIWKDILGLDSVAYDETFFELGGHSLLVVQVQVRLQELIGREIAIVELFNCPTVRALADHFAKEFGATETPVQKAPSVATFGTEGTGSRDIAIIGIGLRFPGASSPDEFWKVLSEGRETIRFFTEEDAIRDGVDPELARHPHHVKAAPMLDEPGAFDADFFRYNAKEARMIDPQQRVFLEVCWEAFEDAGYNPLTYPGKVGLFAAAGMNTYLANNLLANNTFLKEENGGRMLTVDSMNGFNIMITNDKDYLPTRVSYKLNLRGPSVNVQTACSSTLLTLHEACNSILMGDCEMSLAGGVSIKLPQHAGHLYSEGMLNSPDGHCRAYDEKAEGTIFGNGAGVVLLKPLAAARADGDTIYAVVKATASNNDGAGKVGFTAPSAAGEEDVCAEALARAGVSADSVTFVEGHGTGTPLGDPIEVTALTGAFRRDSERTGYCALGSVKTNLGHLQIASGIAGLIKTALALHHRKIPGTLHFEKSNPRIDFARTPFFVNRELIDWKSPDGPRRAGVNSLGIGGTNVHAILEEAGDVAEAEKVDPDGSYLLPLSARNESALRQMAQRYGEFLTRENELSLSDVTFTAQVGRATLPVRAGFVAGSREEMIQQLDDFAQETAPLPEPIDLEEPGLAFLFTGQGTQFAGMGRDLYQSEPVFRATLDRCAEILDPLLPGPLLEVMGIGARAENETHSLDETVFTQPGLFAFEYALAELLASYGVEPGCLAGHSVGEYVAACRAGVFSLEDGLRLIAARGRLMQTLPERGIMLVTNASAGVVESHLEGFRGEVSIAAENGPLNTTVSGETEAVRGLGAELRENGYRTQELTVSHAFHSSLMEPILKEFRKVADEIDFQIPERRLISNLTGGFVEEEVTEPEYWVRHVRETVLFGAGISAMAEAGFRAFVEIGPKSVLCGMAAQTLKGERYFWLPAQHKGAKSISEFQRILARLHGLGYPVDWAQGRATTRGRRVSLPTYPWQHQIYWIDGTDIQLPSDSPAAATLAAGEDPLLGKCWRSPRMREIIYETVFDLGRLPYLAEHVVHGRIVVPGALYLSQLVLQAENILGNSSGGKIVLSDVVFVGAMIIDPGESRIVQTVFTPDEEKAEGFHFEILSFRENAPEEAITHVSGKLTCEEIGLGGFERQVGIDKWVETDSAAHYRVMDSMAIELGPDFRWIRGIRSGEGNSMIRLEVPKKLNSEAVRSWHPGLVDSFLQAAVSAAGLDAERTLIPFSIDRLVFHGRTEEPVLFSHARLVGAGERAEGVRSNLLLETTSGKPVAEVFGFALKAVEASSFRTKDSATGEAQYFGVEWEALDRIPDFEDGAWLLLTDGSVLSDQWEIQLKEAGQKVATVERGDFSSFQKRLLETNWNGIFVGWNLGVQKADEIGWRDQLELVRTLSDQPGERLPRLIFLTANAWNDPAQAPIAGFVQGLAHEHPEWRALQVDLDKAWEGADFGSVLSELSDADSSETELRLQNGTVYGARLQVNKPQAEDPLIRSNGSYLITGASGDLGLAVAEWLVEHGARTLVLCGRRPLGGRLEERLAAWELEGLGVHYQQTDVADALAVEKLVEAAEALSPLRGVFHAAGSLQDGFVRQADVEAFTSVFDAKIDGAWALHAATEDKQLDYFVLFSSIASLLGSPAQANYAAGNAFMDTLARYRNTRGLPGLSIQWGPWDEIGMTARLEERYRQRLAERGLRGLRTEKALEAFGKVLGGEGSVGVFAWEPTVYRAVLATTLPAFYSKIFAGESTKAISTAKSEIVSRELPVPQIEQLIRETVATILGLSSYLEVDREKGLFDLGVDSLMAVDIKNRLEKVLGRKLRATIAFDYPSAATMAAYLGEEDNVKAEPPKVIEAVDLTVDIDMDELSEAELAALLEEEMER